MAIAIGTSPSRVTSNTYLFFVSLSSTSSCSSTSATRAKVEKFNINLFVLLCLFSSHIMICTVMPEKSICTNIFIHPVYLKVWRYLGTMQSSHLSQPFSFTLNISYVNLGPRECLKPILLYLLLFTYRHPNNARTHSPLADPKIIRDSRVHI